MIEPIKIDEPTDWPRIKEAGLEVVVDPMVFRSAEVFLRGRQAAPHASQAWEALSKNIGSLCAFFDALILERRLPMYDYIMTFPPDLHQGKHTLIEWCNGLEPNVLQPVTVGENAYNDVKASALEVLQHEPPVAEQLAKDILQELGAFDWEWRPDIWTGGGPGERPTEASVIDAYRYGGLLFGGYAQLTGCDHLLQPKRARLFLAERLHALRAEDESELFGELTSLARRGSRSEDWPSSPTFLPMLLSQNPKSPRELLAMAISLRNQPVVGEYRDWRLAALKEYAQTGRVRESLQRELAGIKEGLEGPQFTAKGSAKIAFDVGFFSAEMGVEKDMDLSWALGWMDKLPGRRHLKLLQTLIAREDEYRRIDRHLKTLWDNAPALTNGNGDAA